MLHRWCPETTLSRSVTLTFTMKFNGEHDASVAWGGVFQCEKSTAMGGALLASGVAFVYRDVCGTSVVMRQTGWDPAPSVYPRSFLSCLDASASLHHLKGACTDHNKLWYFASHVRFSRRPAAQR